MSEFVKPRFDGGGTEFGLVHRKLGPGYLMLDIDRMHATLELSMEMKRENECWVEFRRRANRCDLIAMFEVKSERTRFSEQALDPREANSMARIEIARRLECRLFVVFGTKGRQPFDFYEIDTNTGLHSFTGTLDYTESTKAPAIKDFWFNVLGIFR